MPINYENYTTTYCENFYVGFISTLFIVFLILLTTTYKKN